MINGKNQNKHKRIIYGIVVALLLVAVFLNMLGYVYETERENAFEELHMKTKGIKEEISLQMVSDRENLLTMAKLAAALYEEGGNFDVLLNTFEPIGLIEELGVLMPDNTYHKKSGTYDATGRLSFEEDTLRGEYVSGVVKKINNPDKAVIRSAVPIVVKGEVVAMLYGVASPELYEEKYISAIDTARLCVIDDKGNFVINTLDERFSNIELFETSEFLDGYSKKDLMTDIESKNEGYTAFICSGCGETYYAHYAPLSLGKWKIMLLDTEADVFKDVIHIRKTLLAMFLISVFIMGVYLWVVQVDEKRLSGINLTAAKTRKLLLEINHNSESINTALKELADFAKSRSAFLVDSEGEDYNYISPVFKGKLLSAEDRDYLMDMLLKYAVTGVKAENVVMVIPKTIRLNNKLKNANAELYSFMEEKGFFRICVAAVLDKNGAVGMIGVVNPMVNMRVSELLKEVAVCFSIAIKNKKYLHKTEFVANTDALTGLKNRTSFNRDLALAEKDFSSKYVCVYADVNELHIFNFKYGHDAGDKMLITIADIFKELFSEYPIYRVGGDEYVVLAKDADINEIRKRVAESKEKSIENGYNISAGVSESGMSVSINKMIKLAEKEMYAEKMLYYRNKNEEECSEMRRLNMTVERMNTGIDEIDHLLMVMSRRYRGIYHVDTARDRYKRIIMPEYFSEYGDESELHSKTFYNYVIDVVKSDYHRALLAFTDYTSWKNQRESGEALSITYEKVDDSKVMLTIYPVSEHESVWVFENVD